MLISKKRIELVLDRFSMLFPKPVEGVDPAALIELWVGLFSECEELEFNIAARYLALHLKRFPFPADFVEQMEISREATKKDTLAVAQEG